MSITTPTYSYNQHIKKAKGYFFPSFQNYTKATFSLFQRDKAVESLTFTADFALEELFGAVSYRVTLQLGPAGESRGAPITPELPLLVEQHVCAVVVLPHALLAHPAHLQRQCWESVTFWCGSGSAPLTNCKNLSPVLTTMNTDRFLW